MNDTNLTTAQIDELLPELPFTDIDELLPELPLPTDSQYQAKG